MQEELVSFETAKLAKEKSFNMRSEPYRYDSKGELTLLEGINVPTQSLLQRWLREVHNIDVLVERCDDVNKKGILYTSGIYIDDYFDRYADNKSYRNYEDALEVGLQEVLKLIKNE